MKLKLDLRRALALAIIESQYKYMEMTGKREFRAVEKSIPEKVLEVSAARECWNILRGYNYNVIQEYTFTNINRNLRDHFSDTRAKKYNNDIRRVDIAIIDDSQRICALIEVKRKGSSRDIYPSGDVTRLRELRHYIKERTGSDIDAIFVYASTMHYYDEDMFNYNLEIENGLTGEKFSSKPFVYFDKNRTHKIFENDLSFCFGAVCGIV
ncbi:hypothetical protein MKK55_11035 [Methylobacterium sp. J-059]|uniref:hypothetical protein n=1 Tax=Methylobacterium sp. J-059 TaxID=2836643 RepID=UPI001FBA8FF2|nr:hypothetical protein [Methylobacterium sp. J-059]MCJ2039470.1 hypothetical protein [Methylobacterium sp. J-059]